jgi:hypothetical protein
MCMCEIFLLSLVVVEPWGASCNSDIDMLDDVIGPSGMYICVYVDLYFTNSTLHHIVV